MKKTLSCLILMTMGLTWAGAQDATTTVQVAPSDQVIYPDASQILNKTEPKSEKKPATATALPPADRAPTPALPSSRPLLAATPVPARDRVPGTGPAVIAATTPAPSTHGWFLRWEVKGDEASVRTWAAALGLPVQVAVLGANRWEVLSGPLATDGLKQAWRTQAGQAQLVKR